MSHLSKNGQHLLLAILLILTIALLAACGNNNSEQSAQAVENTADQAESAPAQDDTANSDETADNDANDAENQESDTRIVSTVMGDVEIPANPQRIVAQGYLPNLLAFDIKPIASMTWEKEFRHVVAYAEGIEELGNNEEASIEKVLSLLPDLIFTTSDKIYEQLSKIAPTIVVPYDAVGNVHDDMRLFGQFLGKEEQAEAWLAEFDAKVEAARAKLDEVIGPDETFSIISAFNKKYYVYGNGIYRGGQAIYHYLQLQPPAIIQEQVIDAEKSLIEISLEVIGEYAGDHIFLDVSNGAEFDEEANVWQSIEAVKNGNVHKLEYDLFGAFDPLGVSTQIDELLLLLGADPLN